MMQNILLWTVRVSKPTNNTLTNYENYLLPFWDEEVERVVVEGKRKDFDIYLVSNS